MKCFSLKSSGASVVAPLVSLLALFPLSIQAEKVEQRVFFYNQNSGLGVTDLFDGRQLGDLKSGSLRIGWTSVISVGDQMLFYDRTRGTADFADVHLDGTVSDNQVFYRGLGWTHVVRHGKFTLLYNQANGLANISISGQRTSAAQQLARGWTHVLSTSAGVLFYNSATGGAAVGTIKLESLGPQYVETRGYAPGSLASGWTHIISTDMGLLFYRSSDGHAVTVDIDGAGGLTDHPNTAGSMPPGWSSIVHFNGYVLFYNRATGAAALDRLVKPGDGSGSPVGTLQDVSGLIGLATGWTHIVPYQYMIQ